MKKSYLLLAYSLIAFIHSYAQLGERKEVYTKDDTLRGAINANRSWWNVMKYDIAVTPDYVQKSISGNTIITFNGIKSVKAKTLMQLDLQQPLAPDSIYVQTSKSAQWMYCPFTRENNIIMVTMPAAIAKNEVCKLSVNYHGIPAEAKRPPWDGGWIWKKDSLGRPWMSVACQGLGASVWYPCKDHQSDEPDNGASLAITIPDTLVAVGNGRLQGEKQNGDGTATFIWAVQNPINNYNIIPYIGKYVNFSDTLHNEKGVLSLNFWSLDYDKAKAENQFQQVKPMLRCFEHWFGPYPFYEDGYQLIESPHLGMEHQSAVAYGNGFVNGYKGYDLSGTGWGTKWDFIIVHESGHEWFANNITTNDIADMWVHEGFTNYSETLYTEWLFGNQAGNEYNYGIRKNIRNEEPITGPYNVNKEGSGDMYYKASNMLHTIRHIIDDDEKFRQILRGLNEKFYHKTVTAKQVETYINKESKTNFTKVYEQYLQNTQIPELQYYFSPDKTQIYFRWDSCVKGFNMPITMRNENLRLKIYPSQKWKSMKLVNNDKQLFFESDYIDKNYYIRVKQLQAAL